MTDTTNTNTNTAHAAALAMRNAAAALARRRPLYDGASGESADEDLAQAIEDLPLPDRELLRHVDSLVAEAAELRRERDELAARLAEIEAQEPAEHLYAGDCPDSCQPDARDPACPACCAKVER